MAATVVYEGVPNTEGVTGTLFAGQKFWFSATVPQRRWFIENVEANGGEVVKLEKQADILLVDHKRKNAAPGTHSYKYVELSIRDGRLENLDDHIVGGTARADRPVGSVTMAPKGGRTFYTEADDQLLWNWIKPLEDVGGYTAGNEIYKQLAAANPRHTYQSWRDRWIKYVKFQNRQVTSQVHEEAEDGRLALQLSPGRAKNGARAGSEVAGSQSGTGRREVAHPAPSPGPSPRRARKEVRAGSEVPSSQGGGRHQVTRPALSPEHRRPVHEYIESAVETLDRNNDEEETAIPSGQKAKKATIQEPRDTGPRTANKFTKEDYRDLLKAASVILETPTDKVDQSWEGLAEDRGGHTAAEWKAFFHNTVLPKYTLRLQKRLDQMTRPDTTPEVAADLPLPIQDNGSGDAAAASRTADNNSKRSPSFRPETPTHASPGASQDRAPGANVARKRSPSKKSNSQESMNSMPQEQGLIESGNDTGRLSPKRKRDEASEIEDEDEDSASLPPYGNQERAKRTKKLKDEPLSLEIPSTPEDEATMPFNESNQRRQETVPGSPTPRPRRLPRKPKARTDESLFVPQDPKQPTSQWSLELEDHESSYPIHGSPRISPLTPTHPTELRQDAQTSPLAVRLVSEGDLQEISASSQSQKYPDRDNGSPTPDFETPAEFSQVWETAQEQRHTQVIKDTQRLFEEANSETLRAEDFALPEPEGGWDDMPLPPDDAQSATADLEEQEGSDESDSSDMSLPTWMREHREADPNVDDELLLTAVEVSNLNFEIADVVYDLLKKGKGVPRNMRGVWTEEDDNALRGNDPKAIERVEDKHGKERLAGRWQWLES